MRILTLAFVISFLLTGFSGCIKDTSCTSRSVQSEQTVIVDYASSHGINATAHSSGLYYEVTNPGTGASPTISSSVSVTYTGKLLDGTIFDQTTTASQFPLSGLIAGWQIGIPLIKKGGSIKLITPSSLAYGCEGRGPIPGNAVLYFEITLVDVF